MNGIAKIVLCSCLLGASQHAVAQNDYFVKGVLVDSPTMTENLRKPFRNRANTG